MMDPNVEKKQELIDWIKGLDSPAMLDAVQRLKKSSEAFFNDKLPDEPAASVEKGG